jgi:hypothetical protein
MTDKEIFKEIEKKKKEVDKLVARKASSGKIMILVGEINSLKVSVGLSLNEW